MASTRDREHFRRIAEVTAAHVRDSIHRAAARARQPQKVPLIHLWREL
jgi:hypothetical protein